MPIYKLAHEDQEVKRERRPVRVERFEVGRVELPGAAGEHFEPAFFGEFPVAGLIARES